MKTNPFITAFTFIILLISCNKSDKKEELYLLEKNEQAPVADSARQQKQVPVPTIQQYAADSLARPLEQASRANPDWDKKMIKTGSLRLEVKNFRTFSNTVHAAIRQSGGYIAQEEQNSNHERTETVITIKVPVDQFENLLNRLGGDEDKVLERKITTEDVTGDIVDTQSRLEAKKQMRARYLELLKQSKNMEDLLQVQNSVNNVQEEIESASGRVQSLSRQALFSTINLTFYQPVAGYAAPDENPSFLTRVGYAFKAGGTWIADLFVGLISIWPLLLAGFGAYFIWRKTRPVKVLVNDN